MRSSCDKESCWLKKHWVQQKMNKKHLTLSNFNKKLLEIIDELR